MNYRLSKEVMTDDALRAAFNELTVKTFGFSFEQWYQQKYWTNSNIPYTLFDGDKAISNISINRMEVLWDGKKRKYIQIGTVMTDEAYRNQGLSRYLMEEVMKDWESQCDAMFLFANQSVLEFYPKFGFIKEMQYHFSADIQRGLESARKLYIDSTQDLELLKNYYEKKNPFSKVQVINNSGLLMFYCSWIMKDNIYYSEQYDAIVIAEQDGDSLNCYDIYCDQGKNLFDILSSVVTIDTKRVNLKFTPVDSSNLEVTLADDLNDTLFVLKGKENLFQQDKILFPEISHT